MATVRPSDATRRDTHRGNAFNGKTSWQSQTLFPGSGVEESHVVLGATVASRLPSGEKTIALVIFLSRAEEAVPCPWRRREHQAARAASRHVFPSGRRRRTESLLPVGLNGPERFAAVRVPDAKGVVRAAGCETATIRRVGDIDNHPRVGESGCCSRPMAPGGSESPCRSRSGVSPRGDGDHDDNTAIRSSCHYVLPDDFRSKPLHHTPQAESRPERQTAGVLPIRQYRWKGIHPLLSTGIRSTARLRTSRRQREWGWTTVMR